MINGFFNIPQKFIDNNIELNLKFTKRHIDKYYYLIDKLYTTRYVDKKYCNLSEKNKILTKKKFIPLHAKFLSKILTPQYYKKILNDLINEKVIEENSQYIPLKKSRSYRLTEEYSNGPYLRIKCKNKKFYNKIFRIKGETCNILHKNIIKNIDTFHFDVINAQIYLNSQIQMNQITLNQYYSQKLIIDGISDIDNFSISMKTGRIFHKYSNLKKELRKFIYDDSQEPMVEVDIANSQPLMLSILLTGKVNNDLLNNFFNETIKSEITKIDPWEVKKYVDLTTNGIFYPYLAIEFSYDLDDIKKKFITFLFSPSNWSSKFKEKFRSEFPDITLLLDKLKQVNYKYLAILLQSIEAIFIINNICPKLLAKQINFIPIHDSFYVPDRHKNEVSEILIDTFKELYGINLSLKYKTNNMESKNGI